MRIITFLKIVQCSSVALQPVYVHVGIAAYPMPWECHEPLASEDYMLCCTVIAEALIWARGVTDGLKLPRTAAAAPARSTVANRIPSWLPQSPAVE